MLEILCWSARMVIIVHMYDSLIDSPHDAIGRLRRSMQLRRQADIDEMQALSELAAEHSWSTEDELDVTRERATRLGADGSPLVGEFLPLEVAAVKGISATAATWLIRDVINLQSRHPHLWGCVCRGEVQPYRAFQIVQLAAKYELTQEQAHDLDTALAPKLGTLGWARLMRLARGLIALVAADAVKAAADRARAERFCRIAPSDEPVVSDLWARLDTTDAQQLDATLSALAKAMAGLGDTDDLDVRRARALGILATPQRATALLGGEDDERYLPRCRVYLHLSHDMLPDLLAASDAREPNACAYDTSAHARKPDISTHQGGYDVRPDTASCDTCPNACDDPLLCEPITCTHPGSCDLCEPSTCTRPDSYEPDACAASHSCGTNACADSRPHSGVARSETMGPIVKAQLAQLFANHRITVTPVVHAEDEPAVDSYEIPQRIAEAVRLRDVCEVFPYSSRLARRLDLDHTVAYVAGVEEQTRPDNLGPLTRRVHRAKTARQWQLRQPAGGVFWWRSPRGQTYRVTPQGTTDLHDWSVGECALRWRLDRRPPPTH